MASQNFAIAFADYLNRLVVRNLAPRTIDKYRRDGTKMVAFFQRRGILLASAVDRVAADAWVADLVGTFKLHPNTRRVRIAMAQGFFRDLKDRNEITVDPFVRYPRPRLVRQHGTVVSPQQAQTLLAGINAATFDGARLRMLLMLCYHAGLRLFEALQLDWSDVDLGADLVTVVGKGNHPAMMPINLDLHNEFSAYYAKWCVGNAVRRTSAVFASRCGNRLKAKDVYPSLTKFRLKGMGQRLWRRSALTTLANAHVPFHVVSGYARHRSLSSLGPYVVSTRPQLTQAAATLSSNAQPWPMPGTTLAIQPASYTTRGTTVTMARTQLLALPRS